MKLSKLSLKSKIIITTLSMIMLMAIAVFVNIKIIISETKLDADARLKSAAVVLGEKISAQYYERYGDAQAFALNDSVRTFDHSKLQAALDDYTALYGIYDLILVVDKEGQLVGSNTQDASGKKINLSALKSYNYKETPWFKSVMNRHFTEDSSKGFVGTYFEELVQDPLMKLAFNEDSFVSGFSAAVKNSKGEIIGVLTNRANKKWIDGELIEMYDNLRNSGYRAPSLTLTNKEGLVISYVQLDEKNGTMNLAMDGSVLLKENFAADHSPVGAIALRQKNTGVMASRYVKDEADDLVGFSFIDNKKWITDVGWVSFAHDSAEESYANQNKALQMFYFIMGSCLFIFLTASIWIAVIVSKYINSIASDLDINSKHLHDTSLKIASSAIQLSESSTEQAAALQETVAAVDEISAMVDKTADNASRSKEVSKNSRESAEKGKEVVHQLLGAIDKIDHSNDEIAKQVTGSNLQLAEISSLINDIGTKTKVINEIVFQTKLLSFNASVEAARAGEYGKGFAVVASEIGNLAQMSGTAAKEITELIQTSVQKVDGIVSETRSKVDHLMKGSKANIQTGNETAQECNHSLEDILRNVEELDVMVSEIAVSSSEQATGIREISKAVGQMETVMQQNSSAAQKSSVSAEELKGEAETLNESVITLLSFVHGDGANLNNSARLVDHKPTVKKESLKDFKPKTKVIPFKKKVDTKVQLDIPTAGIVKQVEHQDVVKHAVGSDFIPSANDPGFNE